MALRHTLRKVAVNYGQNISFKANQSRALAFGVPWGLRNYYSRTRKAKVYELPDYPTYFDQLTATEGFGVDIDLGDYPYIIRPYRGSLDDRKLIGRARFVIDEINKAHGKNLHFSRMVQATTCKDRHCHRYYLTFDASDDGRKKNRYQALVMRKMKNNELRLVRCHLFGDANNPPKPYVKKVVYRKKDDGSYCDDAASFDPETMVAEEYLFPKDYFKYLEQFHANKGLDAHEEVCTGSLSKKVPVQGSAPHITSRARFAVKECDGRKNAQFLREVMGNFRLLRHATINWTVETDDAAERKIYQLQKFV